MRMGQGVGTSLGHGGITFVLQTQFSSYFWSYCPLCVNNFHSHSISLKPLDIFMKLQTNVKHHETIERMNYNSGFPTFGVIALCLLTIFVSAHKFKTA